MLNELKYEKFLGGSGAIAKNLEGICKSINLTSTIGENNEQISFIKSKLSKKTKTFFVNKKNAKYEEMKSLINYVQNKVKDKTGIKLDLEIVIVE